MKQVQFIFNNVLHRHENLACGIHWGGRRQKSLDRERAESSCVRVTLSAVRGEYGPTDGTVGGHGCQLPPDEQKTCL